MMKSAFFLSIVFSAATFFTPAVAQDDECEQRNIMERSWNCKIPYDAAGPRLFHTNRVMGRITWASSTKNENGVYEFNASYAYFNLKGYSHAKPEVGQSVSVVIRAILYAGLPKFE
jgi:hypothetical protein